MYSGQTVKSHESKSGALLDMLAEVASQKLHSDPAVQSPATRLSSPKLPNKSKMVLTLYHYAPSPLSRIAHLAASAVGVDVDIKVLNLFNKDHLDPEFVKINPQHTVPTLQDGDFVMWESRAIAAYLVGSYAKDDSLYPKDVKKRAIVDQRLYFDATTLFPSLRKICFPILFLGVTSISDQDKTALHEALDYLDKFLEGSRWVAGDTLTIADISCVTTVSSIVEIGLDISKHKNVTKWLSKCESEIPGYKEVNQDGAIQFGKSVRNKLVQP